MLIFILSSIHQSSSLSCPSLHCGELSSGACYEYQESSNTGTAGECDKSFKCNQSPGDFYNNASCIPSSSSSEAGKPGSKCDSKYECERLPGVGCSDGICSGLPSGSACDYSSQCNPGLFCQISASFKMECLPLIKAGQNCSFEDGDQCSYGFTCHNERCTQMFSASPGTVLDRGSCKQGFNPVCKSGSCILTDDSSVEICINPFRSVSSFNKPCETCVGESETDGILYGSLEECSCGLSGKSYCPEFPGDEYSSKAFNEMRSFKLSSAVAKCNVLTDTLTCMRDYAKAEAFARFQYYSWMASYRGLVYGAKDCLVERLSKDYIEFKSQLEDFESSSSDGFILGFSALFTLAVF